MAEGSPATESYNGIEINGCFKYRGSSRLMSIKIENECYVQLIILEALKQDIPQAEASFFYSPAT